MVSVARRWADPVKGRAANCAIFIIWLTLGLFTPLGGSAQSAASYRSDRILLQPRRGMGQQLESLLKVQGARSLHSFPGIGGLQVVKVSESSSVAELIRECESKQLVRFAEPDYLVHTFEVPNDPKYLDGTQWGLNKISAPEAWNTISSASNIVVALVDTGVRYTHQDLASNMWVNPLDGSHGYNFLTGTNDPSDGFSGHGTMVAGVLGAVGNNGLGVAGVAWQVRIMACRCFDGVQPSSTSTCIAALDYARTNGAHIVNASWGSTANSLALSNAVYSLREAGIIVMAACGNEGTNVDVSPVYPACYPLDNVVSVAYTTRDDNLAAASNYGSTNVALAAPGEQIYSTFAATDAFYYTQSGTSFAAPYVSGAMALLLAAHPKDTFQQNIARLLNGTDPVASLAGKCRTGGRLNVAHALAPPIRLRPVGWVADGFAQLRVTAGPNVSFVLQGTGDFVEWSPILTNSTGSDGTFDFMDQESKTLNMRFYRAVEQP